MAWFKRFIQKNGMVGLVMTIIAVVYVLGILVQGTIGIDKFNHWTAQNWQMPVDVPTFGRHPWTLLTYWTYIPPLAIWLLIVDMFLVYTFGNILNAMVGDRRTQGIIFFSIIVNGLVTLTLVNIIPGVQTYEETALFGFHSVNATLIAACITLVPRYEFQIIRRPVALIWVGIGILFIMIVGYRAFQTAMGMSMMVGALVGFGWIKILQTGTDLSAWLQFDMGLDTKNPDRAIKVAARNRERIRVVQSNPRQHREMPRSKPDKKISDDERLDQLLDKINEVGYENLSRKEKEELKRLSN